MENKGNYLSIDPSGSGTTGVFFWNSENGEEHSEIFKSKIWKDHFLFLKEICIKKEVNFIVYETTNFIKIRGSDLTSLFKIFGIIESIPHFLKTVNSCETVFVRDIKILQRKLKDKTIKIKDIFFIPKRGGGWFRKGRKISVHEADAFLVLYHYLKKNKPEIIFE